jgi:hypothetical protein
MRFSGVLSSEKPPFDHNLTNRAIHNNRLNQSLREVSGNLSQWLLMAMFMKDSFKFFFIKRYTA